MRLRRRSKTDRESRHETRKFEHQRIATLEDAVAAMGEADGETRILGGGQSPGPMMNLRWATRCRARSQPRRRPHRYRGRRR